MLIILRGDRSTRATFPKPYSTASLEQTPDHEAGAPPTIQLNHPLINIHNLSGRDHCLYTEEHR